MLLRRSLSPSFGHRKWWLGEGHQWEVQQEGQSFSWIPERPLPSKQEGQPQTEMNAWKWSSGPILAHSGFPLPGG